MADGGGDGRRADANGGPAEAQIESPVLKLSVFLAADHLLCSQPEINDP